MNFIIPKNYKFKPKLFGILDYQSAVLDAVCGFILYVIVNVIFSSFSMKLYFFIGLFLPILIFSIIGVQSESIISVLTYVFKYYKNQKIYLYKKNN